MFSISIRYALLAMVLIGTADIINKRVRQLAIPVASYLLINSPFFMATILIIALATTGIKVNSTDVAYSIVGAILSFSAFTIMLHSLTRGFAHINYTIFRLSFVFSTAAAIFFWNENLTTGKGIGIMLAVFSIMFFFYLPKQKITLKKSVILAFCAMLINACFQLCLKFATSAYSSSPSFLLLMSMFFTIMVVFYNIFKGNCPIPRATFLYAPMNGVLAALGTLFYINALSLGEGSTIFPIIQLSFLITFVLSVLLLKERLDPLRIIGVLCAAAAIIVLGWI